MKAILLSVALLFSVAAFAMDNTDATFTTATEDATRDAYDATTGATGGLGATMDDTTGQYGAQRQSLLGQGGAGQYRAQGQNLLGQDGAGIFKNKWNRGTAMNQWRNQGADAMAAQNGFAATGDVTGAADTDAY